MAFIPLCYNILLGYGVYFDKLSSTSFSEVLDLMLASISSSPIDQLPLYLFHKLYFILTTFILNIINIALHSAIVSSSLKYAIIKPILKKPELDIEFLSNYRPISQLPFISKILERIVSKQLFNYLVHIGNCIVLKHFFFLFLMIFLITLIKILIYMYIQIILLYLSAAFDNIDNIVIKCLEYIVGIPLDWIKSYLCEITFSINIDKHYSST